MEQTFIKPDGVQGGLRSHTFQPRNQPHTSSNQPPHARPPIPPTHGKDDRDELRRKECSNCKNPWVPGHRCQGKGQIPFIQVKIDGENDSKNKYESTEKLEFEKTEINATAALNSTIVREKKAIITTANSPPIAGPSGAASVVNNFFTIKVPGVVLDEKVHVLIDNGATHNYIDYGLVERKNLKSESFLGLSVTLSNGTCIQCNNYVPKLKVSFGNFTVEEDFLVFPPGGSSNLVLGVQWLYQLGDYTVNHQTLQFKFKVNGGEVTLQGTTEMVV